MYDQPDLAPTEPETSERSPTDDGELRVLELSERYQHLASLGQGGMGTVVAVRDEQIGREIALKKLLSSRRASAGVRARFLREARVQARLEHPSVVPVYDLGVDAAGDAWFTMKKVRGATLAHIIAGLRAGEHTYSQRRLLAAFSSVCLAIDFAHTRGVIHRDLKPENIMLGDFGEVYVLDWGIAKMAGLSDADLAFGASSTATEIASGAPTTGSALATEIGAVLGTIGYMPPEQLLDSSAAGPAVDVWALGAILFELLALQPLLPRGTLAEAIDAVDKPMDAAPSRRAPSLAIAPELDAICERATARDPARRFASARALHEELALYLDHDLETQRRREQATVHLARARDAEDRRERATAMQEVNRALALDPTNDQAKHAMVRMLVEPSPVLPDAAKRELEATRVDETRLAFRVGALGFLSMYMFLPLYLWMGIRDWTVTGAVLALIAVSAGAFGWGSLAPRNARPALWIGIVSAGLLIALLSRVVGPFASVPLLAMGMSVGLAFNPVDLGMRGLVVFLGIALIAPIGLELAGAVTPSYEFAHGVIAVLPRMTELPPVPTAITLTLGSVVTIMMIAFYLTRLHANLKDAQERIWSYSWNLRQVLPTLPEHHA